MDGNEEESVLAGEARCRFSGDHSARDYKEINAVEAGLICPLRFKSLVPGP